MTVNDATERLIERARIERLVLDRIAKLERKAAGMNTMAAFDARAGIAELKALLAEIEGGDDVDLDAESTTE